MSYYVSNPAKSLFDNFFNSTYNYTAPSTPSTDVWSDEKAYHLEVELPGYSKDEITLEVKDGALTISAEKKVTDEKNEKEYHIRERAYRKYARSFKLGDTLDPESIDARHENGVLTVSISKKEKALPKAITIK